MAGRASPPAPPACCAVLEPLLRRLEADILTAARLHNDDTILPVLARGKTDIAGCFVYVRADRPLGGHAPPAAMFHYSRDRGSQYPQAHLADYAGLLQADACGGYGKLYDPSANQARSLSGVLGACAAANRRTGRCRTERPPSITWRASRRHLADCARSNTSHRCAVRDRARDQRAIG
ncbi:hypothetical protein FE263_18350 [Lichenicoccus roseus]|uniref:Transposase IS66 central domain-containing protein n=1 Tax=Lichenicoccus roseus TaxID=2683649 RepID=A0A5R9J0E1_9PROT|nr:hypothetical protein FE263_18350 [Lichenicoccus roseus]